MPELEDSVLSRIRENFESLFSAEKRVAAYILEHPDEVLGLNISELAQKSEVGDATIVRMCKHLGYQGFYQMKLLMSRDAGQARHSYSEQALNSVSGLCSANAARVASLADTLQMENLLKIAALIKKAKRVFIAAVGNTTPVAMDLGFRLGRCGIPCSYPVLPEYFLNDISTATSDDLLIAISRSSASKQVIQAMELAKKNHMHTLVITGAAHMQLAKDADYVIEVQTKNEGSMDLQPDSHLLEFAINDTLIYIVQHFSCFMNSAGNNRKTVFIDDVELMISEYRI